MVFIVNGILIFPFIVIVFIKLIFFTFKNVYFDYMYTYK